ncbi:hypothetical protein DYST_00324 [Dyella terrae]|nr:hypothetical protein DYST_00324 [Dyella terrae]
MATTGHAFVHAGHRFYYVLVVADRSFSAEVTCDGGSRHRFTSPLNSYALSTDSVMDVCKRLVENAIRDKVISWQ